MNIPTDEKVAELQKKYGCYDNMIEHMKLVGCLAKNIAQHLYNKGFDINPDLLQKAGFLHDIAKAKCLEKGGHHGEVGADILEKEGFPEIARLTRAHTGEIILDENGIQKWLMQPIEEKILASTDFHVTDKIVTLKERMDYLYKRYPKGKEKFDRLFIAHKRFEDILKEIAGFDYNKLINQTDHPS
ncbi:MAG: HD domain-containing protein [Candidatus Woesearchaeota archaeon]